MGRGRCDRGHREVARPGREGFLQASQPNANSFAETVQNEDEWRYQIEIQFEERRHCQSAEIPIVRENDAAQLESPSKDLNIWRADQARFRDALDVAIYRAPIANGIESRSFLRKRLA